MRLIAHSSEYLWAGLAGPVNKGSKRRNERTNQVKLLRDKLRGMPNDIGGRTNI